jgi:acetyltransferase-like isoleucine patch superfamily enzyme
MKKLAMFFLGLIWRITNRGRVKLVIGHRSLMRVDRISGCRNSRLTVGNDSIIHAKLAFDREGATISIGDRCYVGASLLVSSREITLENDVVISWGVTIVDHNSHAVDWPNRSQDILEWAKGIKRWDHVTQAPVRICERAWIGFNVSILKGVTVGREAVIGAGSVVTRDVPPFTVIAGNPARVVRVLNPQEIVDDPR